MSRMSPYRVRGFAANPEYRVTLRSARAYASRNRYWSWIEHRPEPTGDWTLIEVVGTVPDWFRPGMRVRAVVERLELEGATDGPAE